jgi:hypothetical protein
MAGFIARIGRAKKTGGPGEIPGRRMDQRELWKLAVYGAVLVTTSAVTDMRWRVAVAGIIP